MQSENTRRIIRNVLVVGGIVIAVILVFLLIRALFTAGGQSSAPQSEMSQPLLNTSVDRGVKMTVRGPIVANENARSYEVDITPTSRSVTQYSGYDGTVVNKQVYSNSPAAYTQLVYALDKAGMTNSRDAQNADTRGVCATGRLYTFALERDTDIESSLWTSSCRSDQGTLNVQPGNLRNLFDLQIPDILKYSGSL